MGIEPAMTTGTSQHVPQLERASAIVSTVQAREQATSSVSYKRVARLNLCDRTVVLPIAAALAALALILACSEALAQPADELRRIGVVDDTPLWNRQAAPSIEADDERETPRPEDIVTFGFAAQAVSSVAPMSGGMRCDGGTLDLNPHELDDMREYAAERRYHRDSVVRYMTIAVCVVSDRRDVSVRANGSQAIVVKAHLDEMDLPMAHPDSTVLWIDVLPHHIAGERPRDDGHEASSLAPGNTQERCTTYAIRARQLRPQSLAERWDRYQEVVLPLDAACSAAATGDGHHFVVRYAGNATIGLHSLSIRQTSDARTGSD